VFFVQYWCSCPPRPGWKQGAQPYASFQAAVSWAQVMKLPDGPARVVDSFGRVVYSI
jgi:hypothetical protein